MAIYVVTGANRGIGFQFLRQLSQDPSSVVIGLVRDKKAAEHVVAAELGRKNIHLIQADLADYASLKRAAQETSVLTGGSLDCLIANAAYISAWSGYDAIGDLAQDHEALAQDLSDHFNVNVLGNINLFALFLPLVLKGTMKKIIAISSGMADVDLISKFDVENAAPYSISKAALNVAVAKFSAQYRSQGILFMSISPGVVDTGEMGRATDEQKQKIMKMGARFAQAYPHFEGPITPEESVAKVLSVINGASVDSDFAGSFVSHLGTQQWI